MGKFYRSFGVAAAFVLAGMGMAGQQLAGAENTFIIVQSTTSTENSGLYEYLLPLYKAKTGIDVRIVAVGTGQAIKNAGNCDGGV
ncbi:MAG: sulfate transporter, partial [Hyphomicrobiales bacterium]